MGNTRLGFLLLKHFVASGAGASVLQSDLIQKTKEPEGNFVSEYIFLVS